MASLLKRLREEEGYIEPGSGAPLYSLLVGAVIGIGLFVLPLWGIIDASVRPDSVWRRADQSKLVWVLVQLLIPLVGAVAYFAFMRPKLRADPPPAGEMRS